MTPPGRVAYFVTLIALAVAGFVWDFDFWIGVTVGVVVMSVVLLADLALARRRRRSPAGNAPA